MSVKRVMNPEIPSLLKRVGAWLKKQEHGSLGYYELLTNNWLRGGG